MIEVYKIIGNIYDDKVTTNIQTKSNKNKYMGIRSHEITLEQKRICKPVCKNIFQIELLLCGTNYLSHFPYCTVQTFKKPFQIVYVCKFWGRGQNNLGGG